MSLKYLLTALQANKAANSNSSSSSSIQDISQLLLDAHALGKSPKRSEEEWNESLERLLVELRSHPESEPFQKPVPKKLAPDYDKVIAQPMDLSTMGKKIRAREYKNKKQFARDLHLIWQNCMSYNSAPGHPMQAQALYMKKLGNHYLEHILDRYDVPLLPPNVMPQQQGQQNGVNVNGDAGAVGPVQDHGHGAAVGEGPSASTATAAGNAQQTTASDIVIVDGIIQGPAPAQMQAALHTSTSTWKPLKTTLGADEELIQRTQKGMSEWLDVERGGAASAGTSMGIPTTMAATANSTRMTPNLPVWYPTPASATATVASGSGSGPGTSPKANKRSLTRSKSIDKSKATQAPPAALSIETSEDDPEAAARARAEALAREDDRWWSEATRRDRLAAGVPRLPRNAASSSSSSPPSTSRRHRQASSTAIDGVTESRPRGRRATRKRDDESVSLQRRIGHNITTLARMREACVRLNAKMNGLEADDGEDGPKKLEWDDNEGDEGGWESRLADLWGSEVDQLRPAEEKASVKADERHAVEALQVACGGLLAHAGFEGSSEMAMQTLAAAAGRHLEALGRSFRMHLDGGLGTLADAQPEDIVRLSLAENGTTTQDLESHVIDDIIKHGSKLDEMLRRLKTAYDDYVPDAPADVDDEDVEEDDMLFGGIPGMGDMADFLGFSDFAGAGAVPKSLLRGRRGVPNGDAVVDPFASTSSVAPMANGVSTSSAAKANGQGHPATASSNNIARNGTIKKKSTTAGGGSRAPALDYPPPPPLVPLMRTDLPHQIGLLQVFYREKFETASAGANDDAEEDETMESDKTLVHFILDEPCDSSLPPMGNFGQIIVKDAGGAAAGTGGAAETGGGSAAAKRKAAALAAANTNGDGSGPAAGANGAAKRSKANRADSSVTASRGGGVHKALDALEAEEVDA